MVYIYMHDVCISVMSAFVRTSSKLQKIGLHIYIFKNDLFLTNVVQQRQDVDVVRCCTFFGGLISMLVTDILHIHCG
jgi:hypothetical protein